MGLQTSAGWRAGPAGGDLSLPTVVARAGDVNGDGFGDVIVGSPGYANGQTREGRVAVYHGGLGGLGALPAWTWEGATAEARMGATVAGAGDVNGDGFDDVVMGAPGLPLPSGHRGHVMVTYGSPSGVGGSGWLHWGNSDYPGMGDAVAGAGDVNGDGFDDVVLGFPTYDVPAGPLSDSSPEGRVVVFHGAAQGLSFDPGWSAVGLADSDALGAAVAGAGDLNGDGFDDIIAGATVQGGHDAYAATYHGSSSGLGPLPAAIVESNVDNTAFGAALAGAGDLNGDGFDDVIIGALPGFFGNPADRASVYHGSSSGLITTAAWTGENHQKTVTDGYGWSVAGAGDVDADGFSDVIVGAPIGSGVFTNGAAFLYRGGPNGLGAPLISSAESNQASTRFGVSVASAGDVNNDGFVDVIVGAPLFSNGQSGEGRAFVYHGTATGLGANAAWTAESNQANAQFGYSVSSAGDVNNDGFDDVIIGAPLFDNGQTNEGRAFVYLGGSSGLATTAVWTIESNQAEARMGNAVSTAGDVNGDGFGDIIIGAYRYDNGQNDEGRAFVYRGRAAGIGSLLVWTAEINQSGANFGTSVASAGDVNGDGFGDVIVGSQGWRNGQTDEGRADVYLGSALGLAGASVWSVESDQTGAAMGRAVAGAGDVNADGFDDVIVSAPSYDLGSATDAGRVWVYLGRSSGLSPFGTSPTGAGHANAFFGQSVAGAGDLNADGHADIVVGAYGYNGGMVDEGAAFIYAGVPGGVTSTARYVFEGNQTGGSVGVSVSGGDVNGDGLSDLIIGAHYFDNGQTDEGRVFVIR